MSMWHVSVNENGNVIIMIINNNVIMSVVISIYVNNGIIMA
jgi:hypothetical protein